MAPVASRIRTKIIPIASIERESSFCHFLRNTDLKSRLPEVKNADSGKMR